MIIVKLTKKLDSFWGTDEELAEMTDEDIIEIIHEDLLGFLEGGTWEVERHVSAEALKGD